jgi:glycosyltransferase involved in cell wall biosynthesis
MLGLIIPVYNFQHGLAHTFARLKTWRQDNPQVPFRLCFVNDGSTDASLATLQSFALAQASWVEVLDMPLNQGKGACIKQGFIALAKHCDKIIFTDCDLYYGLDLIAPAIRELDHSDIVILDRSLFHSYGARSPYRNLASRLFNKFICVLTGVSFFDTQAGFKAFRVDVCLPIFMHLQIKRFAFDVELLAYATRYLLRIHALPVLLTEAKQQEMQKSTIKLTTTFEVVADIFRISRLLARSFPADAEIKEKLQSRIHRVS